MVHEDRRRHHHMGDDTRRNVDTHQHRLGTLQKQQHHHLAKKNLRSARKLNLLVTSSATRASDRTPRNFRQSGTSLHPKTLRSSGLTWVLRINSAPSFRTYNNVRPICGNYSAPKMSTSRHLLRTRNSNAQRTFYSPQRSSNPSTPPGPQSSSPMHPG